MPLPLAWYIAKLKYLAVLWDPKLKSINNLIRFFRANYVPRFKAEDSSISGRFGMSPVLNFGFLCDGSLHVASWSIRSFF